MNMAEYIKEVEYAVTNLIPVIWTEHEQIEALESQISSLAPVVEQNYNRALEIQQHADDPDDLMMGVGMYWDTYFNEDKDLYHKDQDRQKLANQIATHSFSVAALSGDLLQYAKQGISFVHGDLGSCPSGRSVGTLPLKTIIWQGRNQTMHWEEKNPHPPVRSCFDTLARNVDTKFSKYTRENMAFDVIQLLGWKSFVDFKKDLMSLV